jgi:dihydrofolate reductase
MRKLIASTFTSLDGVMQAPGGPTEDPTGNFTLGGWLFAFGDDAGMDLSAAGFDGKDRELVLGRKTYEIFEVYWPYQSESVLGGDIVSAITALKVQPGHDLQIIGSGNLIQTLQAASLIDEYNVWTYPVVLGRGKRLFENGARPCALRLVASKVSTTGVVMSTYVPAGDIPLGSLSQAEPSAKELTRRAKMATDAT